MRIILSIALVALFTLPSMAQDAKEIIRRADEKMRGKESAYMEMTIEIVRPKWNRSMGMKSWIRVRN